MFLVISEQGICWVKLPSIFSSINQIAQRRVKNESLSKNLKEHWSIFTSLPVRHILTHFELDNQRLKAAKYTAKETRAANYFFVDGKMKREIFKQWGSYMNSSKLVLKSYSAAVIIGAANKSVRTEISSPYASSITRKNLWYSRNSFVQSTTPVILEWIVLCLSSLQECSFSFVG